MTFARLAATAALATVLPAVTAHAQCAISGTSGTCTGTVTTPVDEDIDGLSLENSGNIDVSTDDAVRLRGDDNSVTNSGSITATGSGDEAVQADGTNFSLTNSGTITSDDDKGVQAEEFGTTVVNSGIITSGDEAIEAGDGVAITNSGTVTGAEDGIQYGDGTFTNDGIVTGGSSGDGDAIDIDSGTVTNNGTLTSLGAGSAGIDVDEETVAGAPVTRTLTITNTGTIEGELGILVEPVGPGGSGLNESVQLVRNFGALIGSGGTATSLAGGADRFEMYAGGTLTGDVLLEEGHDSLFVEAGTGDLTASLFDGGDDYDIIDLGTPLAVGDVSITASGSVFELFADAGGGATSTVRFTNFEELRFADRSRFAIAADGALSAIPLPAGLPLLAAGLGALALLRRRRA